MIDCFTKIIFSFRHARGWWEQAAASDLVADVELSKIERIAEWRISWHIIA